MIDRIALLRTGSATGQASPATPDPVSSIRPWLIWIFLATLLAIALALGLARRRHLRTVRVSARSLALYRSRVAGRLPGIAAGVLALDGLARSGTARDLLDAATERYDVARSIIRNQGDGEVASQAADSAAAALRSASELLHVPLPALLTMDGGTTG